MTVHPATPWVGRAALWLCAPVADADAIAGDLAEEYFGDRLPRLGLRSANRWYVSQTIRSVVPLLISRWRRGELAGLLAAAIVTILVPLRVADFLWAFVHSQIPLKADLTWSTWIWIANLAIATCGAAVLGYGARTLRSAVTMTILALCCVGICLAMSTGHPPAWYVATLALTISGTIPVVHSLRKRKIPS